MVFPYTILFHNRFSHRNYDNKTSDKSNKESTKHTDKTVPIGISNSYLTGYFYIEYMHEITKKVIDDLDIETNGNDIHDVKTYFFVDKCKNEILEFNKYVEKAITGNWIKDLSNSASVLKAMKKCLRPITKFTELKSSYEIDNETKKFLMENTDLLYHDDTKIIELLENKCKSLITDKLLCDTNINETSLSLGKLTYTDEYKKLEESKKQMYKKRNLLFENITTCMEKIDLMSSLEKDKENQK